MSLVAYDSSDEGSEDEGGETITSTIGETATEDSVPHTNSRLCLPAPKHDADISKVDTSDGTAEEIDPEEWSEKINFNKLPKPKCTSADSMSMVEEDDIPPKKDVDVQMERPVKKERGPVKITVPSLSEFKDVEEEEEEGKKRDRVMPSKKGTGLFALLPPPKGGEAKARSTLLPHVLQKNVNKHSDTQKQPMKLQTQQINIKKVAKVTSSTSLGLANYDSNSEDEDDAVGNSSSQPTTDFFALTTAEPVSTINLPDSVNKDVLLKSSSTDLRKTIENSPCVESTTSDYAPGSSDVDVDEAYSNKTLVSNVMNLPKEEILLKNKAEVGPKLPVPEQEYNIDTEGNVAFDDKAIEYLCGKRGIKRKNKEIDEANIIEINGEDIKPDEREWLVKALTEEPVVRPVSMQSGGVNSQSKKKHQITYLAHQAKAMEMELKNQWAMNRMTRKQTQSKYGF